jgi:hypothetical protein
MDVKEKIVRQGKVSSQLQVSGTSISCPREETNTKTPALMYKTFHSRERKRKRFPRKSRKPREAEEKK